MSELPGTYESIKRTIEEALAADPEAAECYRNGDLPGAMEILVANSTSQAASAQEYIAKAARLNSLSEVGRRGAFLLGMFVAG